MNNVYYNKEGYYDPTAGEAITNADKAKVSKKRHKRKRKRKTKGRAT